MINQNKNITKIQNKFLDAYLDKSKDTLDEFLDFNENMQVAGFTDLGWIEFNKYDNILYIRTAYSCKPHKETLKIWNKLKKIAKESGCDRIQFTTKRNPKAFKRLFNAKTILYKMEVLL